MRTASLRLASMLALAASWCAPPALAQGSDSCATPQPISGLGTFPFNNAAAGAGGSGGFCTAPDHNVWFRWQPPYGGIAVVSTCGQTAVHTLVNVYQYQGAGCPSGGTVYCSFTGCGPNQPQGYVSFGCTPALYYLIEIGSEPGFPGGAGTFSISIDSPGSTQPFCFGDGSNGPCPCGNSGVPGHGCQNSAGTGGALLTASGSANVFGDTLQMTSAGELPTALTILLQGTANVAPLSFGDGLRCAGGTLKRLYVRAAAGGGITAPGPGDPSITVRSAQLGDPISVGESRYYHAYYRDANASFCPNPPGGTFNVSNGISVFWGNS